MLIGFARVSTQDQTLDLQKDAPQKIGCTKIFTDTASGSRIERLGLNEAPQFLRAGDALVVWRLDRLGRSLRHLIDTLTDLDKHGIGFKSLTESIDTTTSAGRSSWGSDEQLCSSHDRGRKVRSGVRARRCCKCCY